MRRHVILHKWLQKQTDIQNSTHQKKRIRDTAAQQTRYKYQMVSFQWNFKNKLNSAIIFYAVFLWTGGKQKHRMTF